MMYYPHNIHFLWSSLCVLGHRAEALTAADEISALMSDDLVRQMPMIEGFVPTRLFTLVQFGMWDEVLQLPTFPPDFLYATAMRHYGRGLALVHHRKFDEAQKELKSLRDVQATIPEDRVAGRHPMVKLVTIAGDILAGKLAATQGNDKEKINEAVASLERAVAAQDELQYDEPPPWFYPIRQSFGAVLLSAGPRKRPKPSIGPT